MKFSEDKTGGLEGDILSNLGEIINKRTVEDVDKVKRNVKDLIVERESKIKNRIIITYAVLISLLFVVSYGILIFSMYTVFNAEIDLIESEKLNAIDRSINATVIIALIAGTVTQTGLAFVTVAKYIFKK